MGFLDAAYRVEIDAEAGNLAVKRLPGDAQFDQRQRNATTRPQQGSADQIGFIFGHERRQVGSRLRTGARRDVALTKMNWNNTQMNGRLPITPECAKKIGNIMKYVDVNEKPQVSYSFYM